MLGDVAIVVFPGSNCQRETQMALSRVGLSYDTLLWNSDPKTLEGYQAYVIIGGFSYEDRGRAGLIASKDPVMAVIKQQAQLGKAVLGICNGAQILVETGLVPGIENHQLALAITHNQQIIQGQAQGLGFYNAWVHVRPGEYARRLFGQNIKEAIEMPVAHAEGRFVIDPLMFKALLKAKVPMWHYVNGDGVMDPNFPTNPNGSLHNIAAIGNVSGNVLAMMPHPERTEQGDVIFQNLKSYIQSNHRFEYELLKTPRLISPDLHAYQPDQYKHLLWVTLQIEDNTATSLQNLAHSMGYPFQISRSVLWEIHSEQPAEEWWEELMAKEVLYNPRKENASLQLPVMADKHILVAAQDNDHGQYCHSILSNHYNISAIDHLKRYEVWHITGQESQSDDTIWQAFLAENLFFNQWVNTCYEYQI